MATEQRALKTTCEVRQGSSGPMITGYAAVFNRRSADMGFIEQVDPSAFNKTLKDNPDIRAFFNHDPSQILGRTSNGTARVSVDSIGLRYEIDMNPADPDAQRALAKVERGDVDGSSFTFNTIRDSWDWTASPPERRLLEVSLQELGPVTMPAYPDTSAAARRALSPIAERVHRPVDELIEALKTGEIRSLVEPPETEERQMESEPEVTIEGAIEEMRAGKVLSAKNVSYINNVIGQLRELLDAAQAEAPVGSEVGPALANEDEEDATGEDNGGRSIEMLRKDLELRGLVLHA